MRMAVLVMVGVELGMGVIVAVGLGGGWWRYRLPNNHRRETIKVC